MAAPAKNSRNSLAALGFTEIVERGRGFLRTRNPTTGIFAIEAGVGNIGWHYGPQLNQEVDTAWQPDVGAWQYKMVLAEYNAFARNILNAGDIIQYVEPLSGQSVTFQPLALNWVDNVTDSRQQITQPQPVSAQVLDDVLFWQNGYGTGRHFSWQTQPSRLVKILTIDDISNLPSPSVSNPWIEIEFITKYSNDLHIFINNQEWDRKSVATIQGDIEFRDLLGNVLWYFRSPLAWDSNGLLVSGTIQLRKQGANLYSTIRFPKSFIDTSVFPVYLDTTINVNVAADTDDARQLDIGSAAETDATSSFIRATSGGGYYVYIGMRWVVSGPASGDNVSVAYFVPFISTTDLDINIDSQAADSAVAFTTGVNDISGRSKTGNTVRMTDSGTAFRSVNSPSLVNAIQAVISRAGWASGNGLVLILQGASTTGGGLWMFGNYATPLHIEYTSGVKTVSDVGAGTDSVTIIINGSTVWGHITGVLETNIRTFLNNWTGTGSIINSGDNEKIALLTGQYMESEVVYTGTIQTTLFQNNYSAGDAITLKYRHGSTRDACLAASWNSYSSPFNSDGYVQIRVEL